jgi:hypothetical protein
MTEDKAREVFDLAEKKTRDSQLEWTAMDSDDVFVVNTTSGFILRMYQHTSYDDVEGSGPPSLTLYDSADQIVFDVTSDIVEPERLVKLYQLVKRRVGGTDEKLQLIINDLSSLK